MSLVGDIIMDLRARIPDAPSVLTVPLFGGGIFGQTVPGASLPNPASVYVKVTVTNPWGETITTQELLVGLLLGQNAFQIQNLQLPSDSQGTGLNNLNVYMGFAGPGSENNVVSFPITSNPLTVTVTATGQPSLPPTRNTAFLPDTDGNFIGAYSAYRLLNRAIQEMVRFGGGIIDLTGVQSQINQSMYRLESPFYQFINAWYDGYPMDVVPRNFMFLRNSAAGFSGILSYEQDGPQSVIQVWPQSNRTGGTSTLAGNILADTPTFEVFNGAGFLSIGLAQIDNEIMAFSTVQNIQTAQPPPFNNLWQFNGVTRGLGGTRPAPHAANAIVTELNIRLSGYRMAESYAVGDSVRTIQVPQAWETPLALHMLYQVRSMEQDDQTAEKLLADFQSQADKISKQSRLGRLKPRQIPVWGQNTSDARNVNGIGFGWLIN